MMEKPGGENISVLTSIDSAIHHFIFIYSNNNETRHNASDLHEDTVKDYNWILLIMCPLVIFGIGGNLLVIMAISLEKRLQNVTNYFLLSLAVTDFLVALVVMPFSIINEITGKWLFGLVLCDLFVTSDVLMCTSSILHLCTISLERYIGIRYPLWTKNKSKSVVSMKIVLVWTISIAITSPITILGLLKPENVLQGDICVLNNPHFIIYGSIFAFFIPLIIMMLMYGLTVRMLNKQAKLCSQDSGIRRSTSSRYWKNHQNKNNTIKHETVKYSRSFPVTDNESYRWLQNKRNTLPMHRSKTSERNTRHGFSIPNSIPNENNGLDSTSCHQLLVQQENKTLLRDLVKKHRGAFKAANVLLQKRDSIKKNASVKTEQKATKVLGVVFLIFIVCWAPFFIANIMTVLCPECSLNTTMITVFVWLGYVSSTLNPIIYTIFNRIFKTTFLKLLKCQYNTVKKGKRQINHNLRNGLLNCNSSMCASANSASFEESVC